MAFLGSGSGAFAALRGEQVGVSGVGVAPAQVGVQPTGQHGVVGVLGVVEHELAQRPEVRFDRVGPRAVGRGEAQLDSVVSCPLAHGAALVGREVVEDHIDPLAVAVAGPDRLERGQGVRSRLALSHDPPQDVLADRVAAVELSHPVGLVVVRRDQRRAPRESPPRPGDGADRQRPELVEGETPLRESPKDLLDAVQLGVSLGVVGLLPVLVR